MKILGVGPSGVHDPAAGLVIDGKVVAAAEEERFTREKHAIGKLPVNAIKYCLEYAGIGPDDIDIVAFGWSPEAYRRGVLRYFRRKMFHSTTRAIKTVLKMNDGVRGKEKIVRDICLQTGIGYSPEKIRFVEHHLAHASSAFHLSGLREAAILSIDGSGEFTATLLARGAEGRIEKIKEIPVPDSMGLFYSTFTEYLGFRQNNGEYKLMGMAPYGDASKVDFSHIVRWDDKKKEYWCNDDHVWVKRRLRHDPDRMYSKLSVKDFGPPRKGDGLAEPYIHVAAGVQRALEDIAVKLVDTYLKEELLKHGNLCIAGGCGLNVAMNRILMQLPYVKNIWVQPASHDAGNALGAATYVAAELGEKLQPMEHAYLGPEYGKGEMESAIKNSGHSYTKEKDIAETTAELLRQGHIVGWFQGRMEWGPRALGNRSILGNPTIKGTADRINAIIKFREKWRPFCPSILEEYAPEILGSEHPAPFMTIAFKADPEWAKRMPEVVHIDGTCRPQVVSKKTNPRFYDVIHKFHQKTGVPVVINTSLNRRGEPMVCSPEDALIMFEESGMEYLAMGDFLVKKNP